MAEINLLPSKIRPRKSLAFSKKYLIILICLLLLLSYFLVNRMILQNYIKATDNLRLDISQIENLSEEIVTLKSQNVVLENKIESYSTLLAEHSSWGEKLNDINSLVPSQSWITELHMEEDKFLMINGYALSLGEIATFIAYLNDQQYYSSVRLHNATEVNQDEIILLRFEIVCGI
ncbi:MAG: hypothetical protein APF76_07965 [Desulfitibacter sp. BRH_c19]|nr:MAG: hypothetical protein APF76_07965 [Desulfitibacter sp. BRH_c19]